MSDAAGKTQLGPDQNPVSTRKLFSSFLFKALMAVLFLVLVPVMTSHPPGFIVGQVAAPTRGWEIFHILFVGIAVSYGLFSKRNAAVDVEDREKNGNPTGAIKFENAQSYVNRFLQLYSLFDDESDGGGISPCGSDFGRIRSMACNSQYGRNEPMLVVNEDQSGGDSSSARISDKPLLLPIRSLRSRVSDDPRGDSGKSSVLTASLSWSGSMSLRSRDSGESSGPAPSFRRSSSNSGSISRRVLNGGSNTWCDMGESDVSAGSFSRPGSNLKSFPSCGSSQSRNNGRVSDTRHLESETNVKDGVVLPSPIPWRSRSGRMMDAWEVVDSVNTFEVNDLRESPPQVPRSPSSALFTLSTKGLSPSSSLSSVSPEAKIVTDSMKKKSSSSHKSCIPMPPPPPPAATFRFPTKKPRSGLPVNGNNSSSEYRDMSRGNAKSVGTIRASAETVRGNALEEHFSDEVLESEERRREFFKKMMIESEDEETENDDDDESDGAADAVDPVVLKDGGDLPRDEEVEVISHSVGDSSPDVDKKADEFIARFREHMRLQRIESIKRLSTENGKSTAR